MKQRKAECILVIVFLLAILSGCVKKQEKNQSAKTIEEYSQSNYAQNTTYPKESKPESAAPNEDAQSLSELSRDSVYQLICEALDGYEETIQLVGISKDTATEIYEQVVYEHPEFFWADSGYSWTASSGVDSIQVEIKPNIDESIDIIRQKKLQLDEVISKILASVPTGSDYEKALFVHDYLVYNTEYDSDSYAMIQASFNQNLFCDASTAYGCLVNHLAVCEGYAKAFHLIMNHLGIEAGCISGTTSGGSHVWNYLSLDGDYYYIDVTWDDPIASEDNEMSKNVVSHEYFCIPTDSILIDHDIGSDNRFVPTCTAVTYEFFRYNDLFLENYSLGAIEDLLRNKSRENCIQIEFSTEDELQKALTGLFDNGEIFEIPFVRKNFSTVWRSVGNSGRTLTISLGDGS